MQLSEFQLQGKELAIEIEKQMVGDNCKALVVYTGDLAKITPRKVCKSFVDKFCTQHYDKSSASSVTS